MKRNEFVFIGKFVDDSMFVFCRRMPVSKLNGIFSTKDPNMLIVVDSDTYYEYWHNSKGDKIDVKE